ncbi:hypothetical protein IV38_GL002080 [Lactobacillus selangorensis]|uniref:Gcp-like domain-containing protein n=1 Tax=Lactobacillus selangorensis TaxID=81857 RepID=A0A0R2FS33_9LACO|nr:tRNA (adenosine(37)-N6)-threonylcarbamoyltransferase complex dimerization subunit type 1 TsaB [Lactobacillus selangorensis]KRN27428.1 hypothetical protein IV38_GL002080 [Lactobacillus selangorensis]KRN31375.1 hypothetical protein IV40_GL001370 [Lactobacillus selangorensis]
MNILAMDTSNRALSVAVLSDDRILAEKTTDVNKNHSTTLLPAIDQILKDSHLTSDQIDRFVVAQGPGSYTGLRIGVTTAKTFAFTLHKELVGVSSLASLAGNIRHTNALLVPLFDARRDNVFTGVYQRDDHGQLTNVVSDKHVPVAALIAQLKMLNEDIIFIGTDVAHFAERFRAAFGQQAHFADDEANLPHASELGLLGAQKEAVKDIHAFIPHYLRRTQAENDWLKTHSDKGHQPYVEEV